ncbi:MAG: hypothetical protein NDI69_15140 [Bacteriovoracaceae bacterium]|nr:hypothetical protein [Bacteriovoracaceae bacterium]
MNSSQSIEILYRIILELKGPREAKKFTSEVLYGVIDELQEEGREITAFAIDQKLAVIANDFQKASQKSTDVA